MIEKEHQLLEPSPRSPDQILPGYPEVAERDVGRVAGPDPEFVLQFRGLETFAVRLHRDHAESIVARPGFGICQAEDLEEIGLGPVRDEHLAAVDDVLIAVQERSGSLIAVPVMASPQTRGGTRLFF